MPRDPSPEHPSVLYRSIHDQPRLWRGVLSDLKGLAQEAGEALRSRSRIFLVGTGTSYHAAMIGEHLFRAAGGEAWACRASDFVLYPRPLRPSDAVIVISHRGNKRFGEASIDRGLRAGCLVLGITGRDSPMKGPRFLFPTSPQETSSTHTMSYTSNLVALALVGRAYGVDQTEGPSSEDPPWTPLETLPDVAAALLTREPEVTPVADALAQRGRIAYVGAGPHAATAAEGALKVKESSYLVSEGFELETFLHGGMQALHPGDVVVLIAPSGPALARAAEARRALGYIGVRIWALTDPAGARELSVVGQGAPGEWVFEVPRLPEVLGPLVHVIPLQLLACFTAERRGTNPDSFREDQPDFARAVASYHL
jgi:glucosamine--fructose-6-phosphate aminotransferase (isomerizing)